MYSLKTVRLVLPALVLAVTPVSAEPPPAPVTVSVIAIVASKRDKKVEERLKCIAEEVQKAVPQLKDYGFQMRKMTKKPIVIGASEKFDLVDDQEVEVTVVARANKENLVQIKLKPPQMGEVTYETSCGRFLPIVTRYSRKNHDVLILAVRVQPCKK